MYSTLLKSSLRAIPVVDRQSALKSPIASKITAAQVEANCRSNIQVSEEKQQELVGYIKPDLRGLLTVEQYRDFEAYRIEFYQYLLNLDSLKHMEDLHSPLKQLMDYSVEVVSSTGIIVFLSLFKHYSKNPSKEELREAYFYAWAQLITHGIQFPLDDMVDRAPTRRFKPAYYLEVGAQLTTMQIILIFLAVSEAIAHKFSSKPFGFQLTQRWSYYNTLGVAGQTLDAQRQNSQEAIWNLAFREEHNQPMTSPLHDLPLEIAALMTGFQVTSEDLDFWRSIMFAVNTLLRNTNDFNDVYPEAPTGKQLYTDIVNGVGSWCSAKAWELANEPQRQVLQENYGFEDTAKIAKVLEVYQEVNLKTHCRRNRKESAKEVLRYLKQCPEHLAPKELLFQVFEYATEKHGLAWH